MSSDGSKKRPSARRSVAPPARRDAGASPPAAQSKARPSARAPRVRPAEGTERPAPGSPPKISRPSARPSARSTRPAAKEEAAKPRPPPSRPDAPAKSVIEERASGKKPAARASKRTKAAPTEPVSTPSRPRAHRAAGLSEPAEPALSEPAVSEPTLAPEAVEAEVVEAVPVDAPSAPPHAEALSELEETVDRLILEADSIAGDPQARRRAAEALSELAARLGGYEAEALPEPDAGLLGGARELLSTDYYVRRWGRLAMRNRSEVVDDFGLDRTYEARVAPVFEALYRRWFRVTVEGVDRVPAQGRAMIVANHGGALPWDGLMVRTALRLEHAARRESRWLAEDFVYHMPFLGPFLTRVGAVRACPDNAERLLDQDAVLTVFPEGIQGIGKLYRNRYQLQRFGRGGYVKLALRTGAPIVPTGIVGAEDAYPLLFKGSNVAKLAGLPFLPVTPTFPWLGPLGLMPLPSRWVIVFGEPVDLSEHGPDAAHDVLLVNRLNDEIRGRVQELVAKALAARESAYLG